MIFMAHNKTKKKLRLLQIDKEKICFSLTIVSEFKRKSQKKIVMMLLDIAIKFIKISDRSLTESTLFSQDCSTSVKMTSLMSPVSPVFHTVVTVRIGLKRYYFE